MRVALAVCLIISALQLTPRAVHAQQIVTPPANESIEVVGNKRKKATALTIKLLERPRPPQWGSEKLRVWYRIRGGTGDRQVFLRIRQGFQTRDWPVARHGAEEGNDIETTTMADVTEDFHAGDDVQMSLIVVDGKGKKAGSKTHNAVVPQRFFLHPLAREIATVRQGLIRGDVPLSEARTRIADASDAGREAGVKPTVMAALRLVSTRLSQSNDAQDSIDLMWLMANHLEDSRRLSLARLTEGLDQALAEKEISPPSGP